MILCPLSLPLRQNLMYRVFQGDCEHKVNIKICMLINELISDIFNKTETEYDYLLGDEILSFLSQLEKTHPVNNIIHSLILIQS